MIQHLPCTNVSTHVFVCRTFTQTTPCMCPCTCAHTHVRTHVRTHGMSAHMLCLDTCPYTGEQRRARFEDHQPRRALDGGHDQHERAAHSRGATGGSISASPTACTTRRCGHADRLDDRLGESLPTVHGMSPQHVYTQDHTQIVKRNCFGFFFVTSAFLGSRAQEAWCEVEPLL